MGTYNFDSMKTKVVTTNNSCSKRVLLGYVANIGPQCNFYKALLFLIHTLL